MKRLLVVLVLVLMLGGQAVANTCAAWEPWLPKLAERVEFWVKSNQEYPSFQMLNAMAYSVPVTCIDDCDGDVVIKRQVDGDRTTFGMAFTNGGQFWQMSNPHPYDFDLGDLPITSHLEDANRQCCLTLERATFDQVCSLLERVGVNIVVAESPVSYTCRNIRLHGPLLQVIGTAMSYWGMEAWQNGDSFVILRNPFRLGMTEEQRLVSLKAAADRELARHDMTSIDEIGMADAFYGKLAFVIDNLPSHEEANTSWRLAELPVSGQRDWQYASIKAKELHRIQILAKLYRALSDNTAKE